MAKLGWVIIGIVGISQNGQPVPAPARYILHAAPETTAGNGIEARTDILQTGLTLYRLLAGLGTLRAKFNSLGKANYETALAAGKLLAASDFPRFIPNGVIRVIKKAINPDPGERYQSALEMRRALEKLTFPGYWTVDPSGAFIGLDKRHQFRFEVDSNSWGQCVSAGLQEKPAIEPGDAGFRLHKIEHASSGSEETRDRVY